MEDPSTKPDQTGQNPALEHSEPTSSVTDQVDKVSLREDQVQSAVGFLSHPKVKDSPIATKRAFLERKGLTVAEIDEAFSRVPGSSRPAASPSYPQTTAMPSTSQSYGTSQPAAGQVYKPFPQQQQALALPHTAPYGMQAQPPGLRWSQVVLGVGVTAAAVLAVQQYVYPYFANSYRKWTAKSREQVAAAQQRERQLLETLKEMQGHQKELQEHLKGIGGVVKALKDEVDLVKSSSSRAVPPDCRGGPDWPIQRGTSGDPCSNSQDFGPLRPNWGSRYGENSQHTIERRSANSVGGGQQHHQYKRVVQESDYWRGGGSNHSSSSLPAPEPSSQNPTYAEVVDMLQKGITPANVRTDINDQPPDPSRPFSDSRLPPSAKPWLRGSGSTSSDPDAGPHTTPFSIAPSHSCSPGRAAPFPTFPNPRTSAHAPTQPLVSDERHSPSPPPRGMMSSPAVMQTASSTTSSGLNVEGMETSARLDANHVNVPSSVRGEAGKQEGAWKPPPPPTPTVARRLNGSPTKTPAAASGSGSQAAAGAEVVDASEGEVGADDV